MITLIGYVIVREGMMDTALELVKELVTKVRETEKDTTQYTAYTSKKEGNENKIYWYETYVTGEAHQLHRSNLMNNLGDYADKFKLYYFKVKQAIVHVSQVIGDKT